MARIHRLDNPIQHYEWGSHTALATMQGRPGPTREPEAELWIGAHPQGPSRVLDGDEWVSLPDWIASDSKAVLGSEVASRFGGELPFLLKVLAVERPLSLQALSRLLRTLADAGLLCDALSSSHFALEGKRMGVDAIVIRDIAALRELVAV